MLQFSGRHHCTKAPSIFVRWYAASKRGSDVEEADLQAARQWLAKLSPDTIPRNLAEVTFSRSSGPGGQNVNK